MYNTMAVQITERGKWVELVRTKYEQVKVVELQDGTRAYKVGTGRSNRKWHGKFPAASESLPPEIEEKLEPEERDKVRAWLDRRAARTQLEGKRMANPLAKAKAAR
ncbi:hypothetical protein MishRS11D_39280 [Methylomagnum ishizawai]|nr:hypothetical protein MishRS11D_39280 [Methylomagnum ishizawai]